MYDVLKSVLFVFLNVLLPIFIPIGVGYILGKRFAISTNTLTKVQFYVFIPALLFLSIYQTELDSSILLSIVSVNSILFILLFTVSWVICNIRGYDRKLKSAMINSVCFANTGNYCIPLIQLLFKTPFAFSILIIIMLIQNVLINIFGILNTSIGEKTWKDAVKDILKIPMIYAVAVGIIFKMADVPVYQPIWDGLDILGQGLVPMALITLGVQLTNTKLHLKMPSIYMSNFLRLIGSPILTGIILKLLHIEGVPAQVMLICSAAPTAVNTVLLAIEFDNEPDFASQTVFSSTILSAITVSITIYIGQILF